MTGLPSHGESDAAPRARQFGHYTVLREIGQGGMATVFEAVHGALGKRVALKVMRVDVREKPNAAERFFREARAAAQIRHNHIVNVFDVGTEGSTPFIVMDLVEGTDLAAWLVAKGTLPVRQLAELFLPISSAVWSAHRAGIVHRDLKPSNILICNFPRGILHPVLVDFGISKSLDESDLQPLTHSESLLGTPHYMAPEQIQGAKFVTERTDQYAIGVMLYECATGRKPFDGRNAYELMHAIATVRPVKPTQLDPAIPREFETIVLRAMHREPSKRFPSVHALGSALLSLAGKEGWSRWGLEFSGTAFAGVAEAPRTETLGGDETIRPETPSGEREELRSSVFSPRRRKAARLWVAGVAVAALVGGAAAMRVASPRAEGVRSGTAQEAANVGAPAVQPAPVEIAMTATEPTRSETRAEPPPSLPPLPTAIATASVATAKSRAVPRAALGVGASNASDKPASSADSPPSRERGPNGALILE